MTKFTVRITDFAMYDLHGIAAYHKTMIGSASARRITDKITKAISSLEEFPMMGMVHIDPVLARSNYRRIIAGDYVIIYKIIGHEVVVYRIVHGSMDYTKWFK